ncbi:MAG: enoyl-CoA hydratase/isomerase family protein [Candidatus Binatales bacterium]
MAYETLLYEVAGDIATITLNRPAKLNAYTGTMGAELFEAFRAADADPAARVIILTGAGRAFCAGADLGGFASAIESREAGGSTPPPRPNMGYPFSILMRGLSKPAIAAINGYALGVGCTMTLLCDVRIAAEEAKLGLIFPRVGVVTELGSTYLLPRLIGASRAAEMMLTGRHFTASECLEMGLLSHVTPADRLMAKAREIAGEMLQCSPTALDYTRRALYQGLDGTMETAMQFEAFAIGRCYESPEHKEYVTAFTEKRKPDFRRVRG